MGRRDERGAALVEFAILSPLLLLLVLGIIEFGWLFGQFNEIRHAAQEGARWGAVSWPDVDGDGLEDWDDLVARACGAANLPGGTTLQISGSFSSTTKGDAGSVTVTADVQPLTGVPLISGFLPDTLTNTATFRLEKDAPWTGTTPATSCP
jgi:Flp pilus assembly protein TadG